MGQEANQNAIETRIFEEIANERRERRSDIGELHSRIDQLLEAINKLTPGRNAWVQSLSIIAGILTILIPVQIALFRPIQLRLATIENHLARHEEKDYHVVAGQKLSAIEKQFQEVETQFDWMSDVMNLKFQEHENYIQIFWKRMFPETETPKWDYHPLPGSGSKD